MAVDVRRGSPTFGKWVGVELSADNRRQLWVPRGLRARLLRALRERGLPLQVHGLLLRPRSERCIAWNDPELGIPWPVTSPLLSPKDAAAPRLKDAPVLPVYAG